MDHFNIVLVVTDNNVDVRHAYISSNASLAGTVVFRLSVARLLLPQSFTPHIWLKRTTGIPRTTGVSSLYGFSGSGTEIGYRLSQSCVT